MTETSPVVLVLAPKDWSAQLTSELGDMAAVEATASLADLVEHIRPAAIICDGDQADWRGILSEVQIRNGDSTPPIIFLTRNADERLWVQMLEAGAFDLLEKPYRPEDLRWVVNSALSHSARKAKTAATAA